MWQTLSHLTSLSSLLWSRQDHGTNVPEVGSRMQPTMDKKHPAPEIVICWVWTSSCSCWTQGLQIRSTSSPAQGSWLHASLSSWEFSMPESVPTQPGCRGLCKVEGPQGQPPARGMASWFLETWLIVINCLWNYFLKNAWLRWLAFALDSVLLQILINHQGFPVSVGTWQTLQGLLQKMKPWEFGGDQMRMTNLLCSGMSILVDGPSILLTAWQFQVV